MTLADLEALEAKSRRWLGEERGWDVWHALFSRSGFSAELVKRSTSDPRLLLIKPAELK